MFLVSEFIEDEGDLGGLKILIFNLKFTKMKTRILSFLLVLGLGLFMANSAFAVNEVTVSKGSTNTYTVTFGNGNATGATYAWSISPAGYTATLGNTASNSITWTAAGIYTITVVVTDGNGCISNEYTKVVTVQDSEWNLAGETNLVTCSMITTPAGSGNTVSLNYTLFNVAVTNPFSTYTVNYTVTDGTTTETLSATAYTQGTDITINHNANANMISIFTNTTNADKTVTVSVTSVLDSNNSSVTEVTPADHSYTITVNPRPTLTF